MIFENQGSDALRWYFMSTNIVRAATRISDQAIDDVVRQVILPIWNAYSFFTLCANVEGHRATFTPDPGPDADLLDRYILAKTRDLVAAVEANMDDYDLPGAAMEIQAFIDALNNWYIRRSRDRFWGTGEGGADLAGLDTLFTVLVTLTQVAAPFLPMITEEIWSGLCDGDDTMPSSVHLSTWPPPRPTATTPASSLRWTVCATSPPPAFAFVRIKVFALRLPLASVTIAGRDASTLEAFADLLRDELNVKDVYVTEEIGDLATFILRPDGKALGPRLGKDVQAVFSAARSGDWTANDDGTVDVGGHLLQPDEYELALESPEVWSLLRCAPTTLSSRSTPTSRPNSKPRVWPVMSCARSRTPARPRISSSPTASTSGSTPPRTPSPLRSAPTRPTSPNRCSVRRSPWAPAPTRCRRTRPPSVASPCAFR